MKTHFFIISLIFLAGFLSFYFKKMTISGAVAGILIAICVFLGGKWYSLLCLFAFFILGVSASSFRKKEKIKQGLAQENKGKRSWKNALANGGVAAALGILAYVFPQKGVILSTMLVSSLSAAISDTLSSEMGNVLGKNFYNILTFKKDNRGKNGVVSIEGTFCGLVGSCIIALIFYIGTMNFFGAFLVILGGMIGNFNDSLLGATLENRGVLNNEGVNFLSTLVGALVALFFLF